MSPIFLFVTEIFGFCAGILMTLLPWIMNWERSDIGHEILYFTLCAVTIIAFLLAFVGQIRYAILEGDVIKAIKFFPFRKRVYRVEEVQRIFIYNRAATSDPKSPFMNWIRIELKGRDKKKGEHELRRDRSLQEKRCRHERVHFPQ